MKTIYAVLLVAVMFLSACVKDASGGDDGATPNNCGSETESTDHENRKETPLEKLRNDIKDVAARSEHDAESIEVQHLLIAHKDAGVPGVSRSIDEAEQFTAEIYAKIQDGGDFDALVKEHTDDSHPGIYGMTMKGSGDQNANIYPRSGMVPAFGDVGWKLEVGQIGVAPHDPAKSPYGWHIIKRTK